MRVVETDGRRNEGLPAGSCFGSGHLFKANKNNVTEFLNMAVRYQPTCLKYCARLSRNMSEGGGEGAHPQPIPHSDATCVNALILRWW